MIMRELLFAFLLIPVSVMAQDAEQKAESLRNNQSYICGEGWGDTYYSADNNALADLISKISVNISSTLQIKEEEYNSNGTFNAQSAATSVVKSYAQATLTNTENIVISNEPNAHVMRYIRRSEISKIFEARKEKVFDYLRSAANAEEQLKIDDALRFYYWAFSLLRSLQYPHEVKYIDGNQERVIVNWIPQRINEILGNLSADIAGRDGTQVEIIVKYKGQPVTSVDYTYFDGQHWSSLYSAKDGIGVVELRSELSGFQLKYEYEYISQSHIDKELETVINLFKGTAFPKATVYLGSKDNDKMSISKTVKKDFQSLVAAGASTSEINALSKVESEPYEKVMEQIIKAVAAGNYASADDCFSESGKEMFYKLLHYGNARIIGKPQFAFYKMGERVVCRSVPMSFNFDNNKRSFIEDVTFTFSNTQKVESLAFGLGSRAKTDIFNKGMGSWSDNAKMVIASFLENYKTAFALKRLDYIKSIFDDNAIIITGFMTQRENSAIEGRNYLDSKVAVYTKKTKEQYISDLERVFRNNQYVNIRFEETDVMKLAVGGETYGIMLEQDYYSSTYGDHGYLYLEVDVNNPDKPLIKVRTWQPERSAEINSKLPRSSRDWGLIGPWNFK